MNQCNTPPQSDVRTSNALLNGLHSEHETEAVMLRPHKRLGHDVGRHIIGSNEGEVDQAVRNALTDEMVSHIYALRCGVVYWVVSQ